MLAMRAVRRDPLLLIGTGLILAPLVVLAAVPLIVRWTLALDEGARRLPIMRTRDQFSADFYAQLARNWLTLPAVLCIVAGVLLVLVALDRTPSDDGIRLRRRIARVLQRRIVWLLLSGMVLLGAGAFASEFLMSEKSNEYDAAQNVEQALVRAGRVDRPVSNYRDPLPPVMLGLQMRLDPRLQSFGLEQIEMPGPHQLPLKQHNLGVILVGLLLLSFTARAALTNTLTAFIVWVVIVLFSLRYAIPVMVDSNMSEPQGFLFLAAATLFAYRAAHAVSDRSIAVGLLLTGASLGLLSLAKGSYLFVSIVFMVLFAGFRASEASGFRWQRLLRGLGLLLSGFLLVHAPFAIERVQLDQGLFPSSRGGMVLAIRAAYADLDRSDWIALLAEGGPLPVEAWGVDPDDLRRVDGPGSRTTWKRSEFFEADRVAQNAGLPEDAHSFYSQGVGECARLGSDAACRAWGVEQFRADWLQYARITAVVYWSEFWVFIQRTVVDAAINLIALGGLHVALVMALWRRRADLFALSALPIGMMAFHALTIAPANETRFGRMNAPVVALATMVMLLTLIGNRRKEARGRGSSGSARA